MNAKRVNKKQGLSSVVGIYLRDAGQHQLEEDRKSFNNFMAANHAVKHHGMARILLLFERVVCMCLKSGPFPDLSV